MTRTVIVPLDTTPASEVSLDVAAELARRLDAALYLFAVIEAPMEFAVWLRAEETIDAWAGRSIEVDTYLSGVAERYPDLRVETLVSTGHPAPEIVGFAEQQPEPLIVMASHARSGLDRVLIGSVVAAVLHSAGCPVIVVRQPEEGEEPVAAGGDLDRLTVAVDGSSFAEQALDAALDTLGPGSRNIHLVRVVETNKWFGSTAFDMDYGALELYIDAAYAEARAYLERMASDLEQAGHKVTWEARTGLVADELNAAAREHEAGLIVMATHGRTGPGRVLIGSVAERVLHDAARPVFMVNPSNMRVTARPEEADAEAGVAR